MAMNSSPQTLLDAIEAFLRETGMSSSYFGKAAVNNSELVTRLRSGGEVLPRTERRIRDFMAHRRVKAQAAE